MQKYNNRNEVPEEYKWDLTSFFKDDNEFNDSVNDCKKRIEELNSYVGCTKDANKLYEFLTKQIETVAVWQDLYVYANLLNDQDLGIEANVLKMNDTDKLYNEYNLSISFFAPELLKLTDDEYADLFKECPKLEDFKADLDRIYREKKHILSESEEKIVSELTSAMDHFEEMSSTMLNKEHDYGKVKIDNEMVVIAPNNYRRLMKNKDVNVRKKIYKSFNKVLDRYGNSSAQFLNGYVSMNNSIAKIRKYKDSWDSKLFGLNLSDKVFKSLLSATEDNVSVLQKYFNLKKDVLGLDVLHMYDMPLDMADNDKEYSIKEAQDMVRESLKPLGADYVSRFDRIIKNRFIDYCQYKGKCAGGYSFATVRQDSRILMSYNYNIDSVSTIAHESGHNVHHQYVNENNKLQYRFTSSLVAEVISLTNEILLSEYLVNNGTSKEEKLSGLANVLGVVASNFFGAVREGKMEQDMYKHVHKGGTLTKEYLDKLTRKGLRKYYGNTVKLDKYANNSWMNRSHYFMHFYLYSYAICVSVALSVASKILKGDKDTLDKYYEYMKCGSDMWPMDVFKVLGVDLEDKKVYEEAISYFDSLIDKYYEIMNDEEVK